MLATRFGLPPLPGRYGLRGLIGVGGMGEVYEVFDRTLERPAAFKVRVSRGVTAVVDELAEARLLARLGHPGIVPVYDAGHLADGRSWFTMPVVHGAPLERLIGEVHNRTDSVVSPWTLHRLVTVVEQVCGIIAFAHREGVVHRDIKPGNILVGAFGEVRVIDFGIAMYIDRGAARGRTATTGTPGFRAPEHLAGTPPAVSNDVFALGVTLYCVLTGRWPSVDRAPLRWEPLPYRAKVPVPDELRAIVEACTRAEVGERPGSAEAVGQAIRAWLDGSARRARAAAIVEEARGIGRRAAELAARLAEVRTQVEDEASALDPYARPEAKATLWALEAEARDLGEQMEATETAWVRQMEVALDVDPGLAAAHEELGRWYDARLRRAEAAGDSLAVVRTGVLLRQHDPVRYAEWEASPGYVSLRTEPPGATATWWRYVERGRRLLPERVGVLGTTPLVRAEAPPGSGYLELTAPGHHAARYPVAIGRGEHWDGVDPDGVQVPIRLLPEGSLAADEVYVPAGWFRSGGDRLATDSAPAGRLWLDGFVIQRVPVTREAFRRFLVSLLERGERDFVQEMIQTADRVLPRPAWTWTDGTVTLGPEPPFVEEEVGRLPATGMSWLHAQAYASWLSEATGMPWRLPHEAEWEKAARGVDGRVLPWGDHMEVAWANVAGHLPTGGHVTPVGSREVDESPYGVRDVAGNVRNLCGNAYARPGALMRTGRVDILTPPGPHALRLGRGGSYVHTAAMCRLATRLATPPEGAYSTAGFRLVRSLS